MIDKPRDLAELVEDDELFHHAIVKAQAEALRRHQLLGQSVAVWRDGRVVIEIPEIPSDDQSSSR